MFNFRQEVLGHNRPMSLSEKIAPEAGKAKGMPLTEDSLLEEHRKWLAEIKEAELQKRLASGDKQCRACGAWKLSLSTNSTACYGALLCRCSGGSRCGHCLNPEHVY